jgi:hypothetical protein
MTLVELAAEARRLSDKIDAGVKELARQAAAEAETEHAYRMARAVAWQTVEGSAKEREDAVDASTADQRRARDMARGGRQASLEALRSRRQQLSSVQTLVSALKSELEHSQYGPEVAP